MRDHGRTWVRIWWVAAIVVAAALGVWAGRATLVPPHDESSRPQAPLYTVAEETVGQVQSFSVIARWSSTARVNRSAPGIVTSFVVTSGAQVEAGQALLTVDQRPVVLLVGAVPAYRDLGQGATGADVRQLQQYLHDAGFLHVTPDGTYGRSTAAAVRAWQRQLGIEADGVVAQGDVVFVAQAPARVAWPDDLQVGDPVPADGPLFEVLSPTPEFTISLTSDQVALVPTDTAIAVERTGGGSWPAMVRESRLTNLGETELALVGADGGAVCGTECDEVPVSPEGAILTARITVVAPATGPAVPAAALHSAADGTLFVLLADGTRRDVTLVSRGAGRAVVDGLAVGDQIRLINDGLPDDGSTASP